ncbi:Trehalose-phosphate synthase [Phycisphaerae bacterium RAS2]|nr:Trehalose-phosphate synthase [Phycisphaerae bacterium RAS2]
MRRPRKKTPRRRAKRRILIVANRLPVMKVRRGGKVHWDPSPGGLVSAMAPVLATHRGEWVGWSGVAGPSPRRLTNDGLRIYPVPLTVADVEKYYLGFSNATIWPLYHDAVRTPVFNARWWKPYVDVNARFARTAAAHAQRGETVWVHDYQLQLVPRMLRELRPDLRIGYFLHIPFPPDELFAWLPWRREILEGLLGADLIGFQTTADARDFSRAAREFTVASGTDSSLQFKGRHIDIGAYPISIDAKWIEQQATEPATLRQAQAIRRSIGASRKLLLSVDRLDYTKGIDQRLRAFELLLRSGDVTVHDCVLMQVAVPSRETVAEYREQRENIERIVGRINGEFSVPGRVPVHYFRRGLSREELVAYYLAADVMVVTPLKDGMNLVAKEYVAARRDNTGVLMLSEFTGAARELRQALLVNPHDIDAMVHTLHAAMELPRSEARTRMAAMRANVRRHDVHAWARNFLRILEG